MILIKCLKFADLGVDLILSAGGYAVALDRENSIGEGAFIGTSNVRSCEAWQA